MDITSAKFTPDSREAREFYSGGGAAIPVMVVLPGANPFWFLLNRLWDSKNYFAVCPDGSVLVSGDYPDEGNTDTQNSVARAVLARVVKEFRVEIPNPVNLIERWRRTSTNWNCVYTYNKVNREWDYVQLL